MVRGARVILIWPLVLKGGGAGAALLLKARDDLITRLAAHRNGTVWCEEPDLLDHLEPSVHGGRKEAPQRAESYAEFVYFYDFLQSVLFEKAEACDAKKRMVRLFKRLDIASAEIWLSPKQKILARVERCNLYLFATGAASLVVEFDLVGQVRGQLETSDGTPLRLHRVDDPWLEPLTLAEAQTCIDRLRRTYAPYYAPENGEGLQPQLMAHRLRFLDRVGNDIALDDRGAQGPQTGRPLAFAQALASVRARRTVPTDPHWQALLAPLVLEGHEPEGYPDTEPRWRHVIDERIPVMSYISLSGAARQDLTCDLLERRPADLLDDLRKADAALTGVGEKTAANGWARRDLWSVSRGDWMRLCFADPAGSDPMPYAPAFLEDFERIHCYDRYFPSPETTSSSRTLFCGYNVCFVGSGFFFDHVMVQHFRRHYFQMALLLNMEFATLLSISGRISAIVRDARQKDDRQLDDLAARKEILTTQKEFLDFVHLYRFTGVSNQIQPREMYDKWRETMGIDRLYADVKEELQLATSFALAVEQAEQTDAGHGLNILATLGVVFGLIIALLSMNFLIDANVLAALGLAGEVGPDGGLALRPVGHVVIVSSVAALVSMAAMGLLRRLTAPRERSRTKEQMLSGILWGVLIVSVAGLLLALQSL